jgi:hypothetical protein
MDGLEMSSDILAARERATYAPLDNPDRRHEPDGVVPLPDKNPDKVTGIPGTGSARHETGLHESANQSAKVERQSVLVEAQGLVHGARNVAYGPPIQDYTRTAGMVSAMLAHKLKEPLTAEDLICAMICVKLSRQQNAPKRDNAVDGAGYFECLQWVIDSRAGQE